MDDINQTNQSNIVLKKFNTTRSYSLKLVESLSPYRPLFIEEPMPPERVNYLNQRGIKFVTWGRTNKQTDHAWIDLDNRKSIEILMNKLSTNGHKRIAFIMLLHPATKQGLRLFCCGARGKQKALRL